MFIDCGTLQAEVDAKATDDRLNAVLSAVIRNLDFVDLDPRHSQKYAGTNLPVELVFALLESGRGDLRTCDRAGPERLPDQGAE